MYIVAVSCENIIERFIEDLNGKQKIYYIRVRL